MGARANLVIRLGRMEMWVFMLRPFRVWHQKYPEGVVDGLDVVEKEAYLSWIRDSFKNLKLKHPTAAILLTDQVVFRKNSEAVRGDLQQFWDEVPLTPEVLSKHVEAKGGKVEAMATNKDLYEPVKQAVEETGGQVVGVLPETDYFTIPVDKVPGELEIKRLMAKGDWGEQPSFVTNDDDRLARLRKSGVSRKWMGASLGLTIVVLGAGSTFLVVNKVQQAQTLTPSAKEVSPSMTPTMSPETQVVKTPIPTQEVVSIAPEDLNLQVLNGSGVPGAATEAKDFLNSKGYTNVSIGNASSSAFVLTEIAIKPDKKGAFLDLARDLGERYKVATVAGELSAQIEFDAVVTLGQE